MRLDPVSESDTNIVDDRTVILIKDTLIIHVRKYHTKHYKF